MKPSRFRPAARQAQKVEGKSSPAPSERRAGKNCIHLIMDYEPGDLAVAEVTDALCDVIPDHWHLQFTKAHSFKTTETGFIVGQIGLKPRKPKDSKRILYVNCAPRKDRRDSRSNNEGEGLVYGVLKNGVEVVAVNSGYSLSVIRNHLQSLYDVKIGRAHV